MPYAATNPTGTITLMAEETQKFGANAWLVDEMYEQFRRDPQSVNDTWQEFFSDYRPAGSQTGSAPSALLQAAPVQQVAAAMAPPSAPAAGNGSAAPPPPAPGSAATRSNGPPDSGAPIRGVGAVIVANMERSLEVPTATSFRNVPAKLLEVNRSVINGYQGRSGKGKVSFTHLIGYAIVRAIADAAPVMNNSFIHGADGAPRLIRNEHVSMGLAVFFSNSPFIILFPSFAKFFFIHD